MILDEEIKIKPTGKLKQYFEDKGYVIKNIKDEIIVKVEDLPIKSTKYLNCKCDNCNNTKSIKYQNYNLYLEKYGKYYCNKCKSIKMNYTLAKD